MQEQGLTLLVGHPLEVWLVRCADKLKIKGKVKNIEGESSITGLKKFKIKVKEGDFEGEKAGLGDDIGHALFASNNQEGLKNDIKAFKARFKVAIL